MNPPLTAAAEIAALSAAELAAASRIWFGQCCRALLKKGLVTPVKKKGISLLDRVGIYLGF